jgi:hypothetical protein
MGRKLEIAAERARKTSVELLVAPQALSSLRIESPSGAERGTVVPPQRKNVSASDAGFPPRSTAKYPELYIISRN